MSWCYNSGINWPNIDKGTNKNIQSFRHCQIKRVGSEKLFPLNIVSGTMNKEKNTSDHNQSTNWPTGWPTEQWTDQLIDWLKMASIKNYYMFFNIYGGLEATIVFPTVVWSLLQDLTRFGKFTEVLERKNNGSENPSPWSAKVQEQCKSKNSTSPRTCQDTVHAKTHHQHIS